MKKSFLERLFLVFIIVLSSLLYGCKDDEMEVENSFVVKSSISDVDIHYTVKGKGSHTIVFVHGWSCDQTYWKNQIDYFENNYKVVTIDLGGHGKSGTNRATWTIASYGSDVIDVVNAIEFEKLSLVGHSLGSMVVVDVASRIDKPINALVCVDYLKDPLVPISNEIAEGLVSPFRTDFVNSTKGFVSTLFRPDADPVLVAQIADDMSNAPPEVAIPAMINLGVRDYSDDFKKLSIKNINRYIINADLNKTDKAHYISLGFEINIIKGSGHFVMIEKPDLFNPVLKEIVNE
ncbi:alpha/beta fold hydrolase [Flavivirga rizhaonensis]|uniref:Alpha/beta hydrolase n=1 Tax=Flavivirga rizhaonensis TaxID=2559571 RepID=A0A4V3P4V0_9FLAO|nr:alpha/beta hydrolase [Flavivirga rizhaonensis]TGV02814.1 alpha/beta hydrolase [Flavivirga rizhaonensis]